MYASPSLEDSLANAYPHYPPLKRFEIARHEPLIVVHTSGTNAVPKPIVYSHDFAASYVQLGQLEPPQGFEAQVLLCESNCFFVTLPLFHVSSKISISGLWFAWHMARANIQLTTNRLENLYATLFDAVANQIIIITPASGAMPSARLIFDGFYHTKADAYSLPHRFLNRCQSPVIRDFVTRKVHTVAYGGGDISQWDGILLLPAHVFSTSRVRKRQIASGRCPLGDWKWIQTYLIAGIEFRPSLNGLFEAVVVRSPVLEDE